MKNDEICSRRCYHALMTERDKLNCGMFKTYDIRTRESRLTDEVRRRLTAAVAYYYRRIVKAESVLLSHDARLGAPALAEALIEEMRRCGIEVLYNPLPVSTCQFYYSLMRNRDSGGIMVTASHNSGEYIGLKLLSPGLRPVAWGCGEEGGIRKIREIYEDGLIPGESERGGIRIVNYLDDYISYALSLSGVKPGSLKGIKILLEFLSGSAGTETALAFQKAGAEIEVRNITPDGFFPSGDPNPVIESSISPARKALKSGDMDFGFCFDGDGDRLDFMTGDGEQIAPSFILPTVAGELMKIYGGRKRRFYLDVKASPVAALEMIGTGADVHMIRNGHSFIKEKLGKGFDDGFVAAVEESAHYYMNFPFDPAHPDKGSAAVESTLFFALLISRCYMEHREAFERVMEKQDSLFRVREWPFYAEGEEGRLENLVKEIEDLMIKEGAAVIKTMDDGSDLDCSLFRFNLPSVIDDGTDLSGVKWIQCSQRISRSEDGVARWEIVSNDKAGCSRVESLIRSVTDRYAASGWGRYQS